MEAGGPNHLTSRKFPVMAFLLVFFFYFRRYFLSKLPVIPLSENSFLWLIFTTCLLINFLASSSTILSLAFFFISPMISRQKGLSTPPTHHSLSCLHACIQIFPPPKRPFPPPLPHLIPCLVHLVVLVILKNSFPSLLESLPHLLLLPPGRVSCSLFSTPIMPSFHIYIVLITSLYNNSLPHRLYS